MGVSMSSKTALRVVMVGVASVVAMVLLVKAIFNLGCSENIFMFMVFVEKLLCSTT